MTRHFINKDRVFQVFEKYCQERAQPYDVVVVCRVDIMFQGPPLMFRNLCNNHIYIPRGNDFRSAAINDQIAWGSVDVMKRRGCHETILFHSSLYRMFAANKGVHSPSGKFKLCSSSVITEPHNRSTTYSLYVIS